MLYGISCLISGTFGYGLKKYVEYVKSTEYIEYTHDDATPRYSRESRGEYMEINVNKC